MAIRSVMRLDRKLKNTKGSRHIATGAETQVIAPICCASRTGIFQYRYLVTLPPLTLVRYVMHWQTFTLVKTWCQRNRRTKLPHHPNQKFHLMLPRRNSANTPEPSTAL